MQSLRPSTEWQRRSIAAQRARAYSRVEIDQERCRRSLATFIRKGWSVLEPGADYTPGRVIDAIAEHLEAVTAGQISRLLINVPPGTMKSLATAVFWPAWEWGPRGLPHNRFLSFSYADRLSTRDNRRTKLLVQSPWFQERWPLALSDDQNTKTKFENSARGWRMASSVTGVGTGERGDRVIVDDPHHVLDANSPAKLERALLWFRETLPTRVNDPQRSAIVVIMQRVHGGDISGEIIEKELGYEHLMLPMRYEPERHCRTGIGFEDWRSRDGELLFPERFPAEVVDRDERLLGSYATAAQMQQRPSPRGGGMLPVDSIVFVKDWPRDARLVRRWDFAATDPRKQKGSDPDWTRGGLVAIKDGRYWILDMKGVQGGPGEVERLVKTTAQLDGPAVQIVIPQDPGAAGVAVADHYRRTVLPGANLSVVVESGSKVERAWPLASAMEAGNVHMVEGSWNAECIAEMRDFPNGRHDDQVDVISGAVTELATGPLFAIHAGRR